MRGLSSFVSWTAGPFLLLTTTNVFGLPHHGHHHPRRYSNSTSATACAAVWEAGTIYQHGALASQNNVNYLANWWTQNNEPSSSSGAAGSGQPWTAQGPCGSQAGGNATATVSTSGQSTRTTTLSTSTSATIASIAHPITPSSPSVSSPSTFATIASIVHPMPNSATATSSSPISTSIGNQNVFFSPYKDVTINTNWNTNVMSTKVTGGSSPLAVHEAIPNLPALSWAFATGECGAENWGGIPGAKFAAANVATFSAAKIPYILSTGGAGGVFTCGSDAGFATFIDRYASSSLVGVDFDIEAGQTSDDIDALIARVKAAQTNAKYKNLRFSFTIATLGGDASDSLGGMGKTVMQSIKAGGLEDYLVNLMTMDYGTPTAGNCVVKNGVCDMGASANHAAENLHAAYGIPYNQIELTPMIGGNDVQTEVFSIADVATVTAFARIKGLAGLHTWSLDRDTDCAPGSASPSCNSYGEAGVLGFLRAFLKNL